MVFDVRILNVLHPGFAECALVVETFSQLGGIGTKLGADSPPELGGGYAWILVPGFDEAP